MCSYESYDQDENKKNIEQWGKHAAIIASLPDQDRHSEKSKDRGCKCDEWRASGSIRSHMDTDILHSLALTVA